MAQAKHVILVAALLIAPTNLGVPAQAQDAQSAVQGCVITGGTNSHINQTCVFTIDPVPKVLVYKNGFDTVPSGDGTYLHTLKFRLSFGDGLSIRICGKGVISSVASTAGPIALNIGEINQTDNVGCLVSHYQMVVGNWELRVQTRNPTDKFSVQMIPD
jgi:hypothetical protein